MEEGQKILNNIFALFKRFKHYLIVFGFTLVGHALGFGREIAIAYNFGASALSDGLSVGLIPITIYVSAWGGAYVNAALTQIKTVDNTELVAASLQPLIKFGVFTCIILFFGAQLLVELMSPGLSGEGRDMAISLIQVSSIGAVLVSVAAWGKGLLHLQKKFTRASTADVMPNLGYILGLVILFEQFGVYGVAIGGLIGYTLQFAFSLEYKSEYFKWTKNSTEIQQQMKQIFRNMLLATASYSVNYIDLVVDRYFASMLEQGSIAIMSFAHKLMIFPLYTLIFAITTVMFPNLIQLAHDMTAFRQKVRQVYMVIFGLTLVITIVAIALDEFIVSLLFEWGDGAFDAAAVKSTASVYSIYMLGFMSQSMIVFSSKVLYALQNFKIPVIAGLVSAVVNVALDFALVDTYGREGLALATAISAFCNAGVLLVLSRHLANRKASNNN
jgi:putative peptidoglycan lipid II flippase